MKTNTARSGHAAATPASEHRRGRRVALGCLPGIIALIAISSMPLDALAQKPDRPDVRTGRILVGPKPGLPEQALAKILERAGGRELERIPGLGVRVVEVPEQAEAAVAAALRRRQEVAFAEPDRLVPLTQTANDPYYSNGWHLQTMNLPEAWPVSLGDGVTIAILDTGVDPTHPDLVEKLVFGYNAVSQASGPTSDDNGHGTRVAGSAAAVSDNGIGVTSIAWDARIMPVRVSNRSDGAAYWSDIARGLTWAADNGARVANISYAAAGSSTVKSAAQYFKNNGGLVVNSAGNSSSDPGDGPSDALITVSATGSSDVRTSWSSFGNMVDVAAPGAGIYTTSKGGGYGAASGTSFSSPVTAGVVAMMMSAAPSLTPDEVVAVLKLSAVDLGESGWDPYYGEGRVDAAAAVQMASTAQPGDTQAPNVALINPATGEEVSELVNVDVQATDEFGVTHVELLVNGQPVATDNDPPYSMVWDTTTRSNGEALLMVYAYDAAENRGNSQSVQVMVANTGGSGDPPQVTITSPADGATVSGSVTLSAFASHDQPIAEVRIAVDGRLKCAGSPSVSCNWNARKASAGSHTVTATAKDFAGKQSTQNVSVTVGSGSSKGGGGGKGGGKGKKK